MKYVIQYQPTRTNFLETMTEAEGNAIDAHFGYLKRLLSDGVLVFAGRRGDGAFGLAVFEEASDHAAKRLMENDPAVKAGVFSASVGQFSFALAADPKWL